MMYLRTEEMQMGEESATAVSQVHVLLLLQYYAVHSQETRPRHWGGVWGG
jgi:hypothetical protein